MGLRSLIGFTVVLLLQGLALGWRLVPHDLVLTYPFLGGDSLDWIANGLFWAGHPTRFSGRPPLLP